MRYRNQGESLDTRKRFRWPVKLILARFFLSQFSSILFCRYLKQFAYKRGDFSLIAALNSRALYWFPLKSYNALLWQTGFRRILKIDMTAEFVQLARMWIRAISLKKRLLEKELGKDVTNGLLKGDILVALKLAEAGLIGRAFFYGEKPVTGLW